MAPAGTVPSPEELAYKMAYLRRDNQPSEYQRGSATFTGIDTQGDRALRPDSNAGILARTQRTALVSHDGMPDLFDFAAFGFTTNAMAVKSEKMLKQFDLYDNKHGFVFNRTTGELDEESKVTSKTLENYIQPSKRATLDQIGFDYEALRPLDLDSAERLIKRTLLQAKLDQDIVASTDSKVEQYAASTAAFLGEMVDPSLVIGLGAGSLVSKAGSAALKATVNGSKSKALHAMAKGAGRFQRNRTLTGAALDNNFTRKYATTMLAFDTAVMSTPFDLAAQWKENEVAERYFGETDANWWSPTRSAANFLVAGMLGGSLGKLFGFTNGTISRQKAVDDVLDRFYPEGSPGSTEGRAAMQTVFDQVSERLVEVQRGGVKVTDDNAEEITGMMNDMIDSMLVVYNNDSRTHTFTYIDESGEPISMNGLSTEEYLRAEISQLISSYNILGTPVSPGERLGFDLHTEDLRGRVSDGQDKLDGWRAREEELWEGELNEVRRRIALIKSKFTRYEAAKTLGDDDRIHAFEGQYDGLMKELAVLEAKDVKNTADYKQARQEVDKAENDLFDAKAALDEQLGPATDQLRLRETLNANGDVSGDMLQADIALRVVDFLQGKATVGEIVDFVEVNQPSKILRKYRSTQRKLANDKLKLRMLRGESVEGYPSLPLNDPDRIAFNNAHIEIERVEEAEAAVLQHLSKPEPLPRTILEMTGEDTTAKLDALYKERDELDREFDEFIADSENTVEVDLETGLERNARDRKDLGLFQREQARVQKEIERLEKIGPSNQRVEPHKDPYVATDKARRGRYRNILKTYEKRKKAAMKAKESARDRLISSSKKQEGPVIHPAEKARIATLTNEQRVAEAVLLENEVNIAEIKFASKNLKEFMPEIETTGFRTALRLREEANDLWLHLISEKDVEVRTAQIKEAKAKLDTANRLIKETKEGIIPLISNGKVNEDVRLAAAASEGNRLLQDLDNLMVTPPSKLSNEQARMLLESHFIDNRAPVTPIRNDNVLSNFIYSDAVNAIAGIGTDRATLERIAKVDGKINNIINMISNLTYVSRSYANSNNKYIANMTSRLNKHKTDTGRKIVVPYTKLRKRLGNEDELNEALMDAARIAYGLDEASEHADINELAAGISEMYKRYETIATQNGMLADSDPNFVHMQVIEDLMANPKGKKALEDRYYKYLKDLWKLEGDKSPVFRKALDAAFILRKRVDDSESFRVSKHKVSGEDPTIKHKDRSQKLSEWLKEDLDAADVKKILTPKNLKLIEIDMVAVTVKDGKGTSYRSAYDLYKSSLDGAVREEAEEAIKNLNRFTPIARRDDGTIDVDAVSISRRADHTNARKIPMEVLLDRDVLASGAVHLDPVNNIQHYWRTFGYDVTEQQMMTDMFGTKGITFDQYVDYAIRDFKTNNPDSQVYTAKDLNSLRDSLLHIRNQVANRSMSINEEERTLTYFAALVHQLTSIPVNARIALMMPATEIAFPAVSHLVLAGNRREALTDMIASLKDSFSKEERYALGRGLDDITIANRALADNGLHGDQHALTYYDRASAPFRRVKGAAAGTNEAATFQGRGRVGNTILAAAEAGSEFTRNTSGELLMTRMGQTFFGLYHMRRLQSNLPRLKGVSDDLKKMPENITTKQLKAVARKNGISLFELQQYREFGLLSRGENPMQDISNFMSFMGNRKLDFGKPSEVWKALESLDAGPRRETLIATWERALDMTRSAVDRDITNPGVFDRPTHGGNAIVSFFSRYLSFSRGFRTGKMNDVVGAGFAVGATSLIGVMLAEIFNRTVIDITMHGQSAEDAYNEWMDDPKMKLLYSLNGVPAMGGGQGLITDMLTAFVSKRNYTPNLSPSAGILAGNINSVRRVLTGSDMDEEDVRRFLLNFPGINNTVAQAMLSLVTQSDEDEE